MDHKKTAIAEYLFHQGTNDHAYEYLGAHPTEGGYLFRTWAPNARAVALTGDMTDWSWEIPLSRISEKGVWELFLESDHSLDGRKYKFAITGADGIRRLKGDPYAFSSEGGSGGASLICDVQTFSFHDGEWMEHRRRRMVQTAEEYLETPIHIYELHAASLFRHADGGYPTYRELAEMLVSYVRMMGFTHVELLPLSEYPYDGSWGYQVGAYYAPTARFGEPAALAYLVDRLHNAGIGVLMDWVPAHFPKDEWGLYEFDGQPLYEYQGADRMESRGWGTRYFDVGREEVQSFLVSNALYWLRVFHLDGLRVDAVAAMLYRDYDRGEGEWSPNSFGGKENLESIAFFRKLNAAVHESFPDALMIAEESTAFPRVTMPVEEGGLGFSLKWNMGFANDMFQYLGKEGIYRRYHHAALTFPMLYAYSEKYILPVSHDEVVHGKRSLLEKISERGEEKMELLRAFYLFLMTFPGKKMLFMGSEFGQHGEWCYDRSLDWHLLEEEDHRSLLHYMAALGHFYLATPSLWEQDFSPYGFSWIEADLADQNTVAYRRRAKNGEEILAVISFCGEDLYDFRLNTGKTGVYDVIFYSGNYGMHYEKSFTATEDRDGAYLMMRVPARTGILLRRRAEGVDIPLRDEEGGGRRNV